MPFASDWVSQTQINKGTEANNNIQAQEYDDDEDDLLDSRTPYVPTISPPSSFESFLLPLGNQQLTAFAQTAIKVSSSSTRKVSTASARSTTNESVVTDEFASAADNLSNTSTELDDISFDEEDQEIIQSLYKNDILGLASGTTNQTEANKLEKEQQEEGTPTRTKMVSFSVPVSATTTTTAEPQHFDVAEKVYEGVKTAWTFGKGFGLLKPFMNIAEGAAVKVIGIVTGVNDLETVDSNVKPHVVGIDRQFLDPAILKVLELVTPLVSKGDEFVKSILAGMKPAIKSETEKSSTTTVQGEQTVEPSPVKKNPLEGVLPLFSPSPVKKGGEECDAPETSTPVAPAH